MQKSKTGDGLLLSHSAVKNKINLNTTPVFTSTANTADMIIHVAFVFNSDYKLATGST